MIKKYKASIKEDAIKKAYDELGSDAIVLSIKKVTPRGLFSSFRKSYVEVLATNESVNKNSLINFKNFESDFSSIFETQSNYNLQLHFNEQLSQKDEQIKMLQNQLNLINKTIVSNIKYKNDFINFIYNLLKKQQVYDELCVELLAEFQDGSTNTKQDIDFIIKSIYNKIFYILQNSKATPISFKPNISAKKVTFIGNTGVGKTTTIAKISSNLIMQKSYKVAFVTLDTYRIAAAEQLKVYADILDCEVKVIYDLNDIKHSIKPLEVINDFIFFDTAGRSHNNNHDINEIKEFIKLIPDSQNYLILSACAKFEDIINIINTYSEFMDFNIIFTKLDETNFFGNILNIAKYTNKKIAYFTTGQNVPNDIEEFSPAKISKKILESIYK